MMNIWQISRRTGSVLLAVLAACIFAGCGSLEPMGPQTSDYPPVRDDRAGTNRNPTGLDTYLFQIGDLVRVDYSGVSTQQIPPHEENIKDDGTITVHLVGRMKAAGKTAGQLQKDLQEAYTKYYKNLNVTVRGGDLYYYVGGRVRQAGRQQYLGPITVTGAIKSAGDFDDFANPKKVRLIRADGKIHIIDAKKALQKPELDLRVYPGDRIEVPKGMW